MGKRRRWRRGIPYSWSIKPVLTYSPMERKVRLLRIVWARKGGPGSQGGWSSKLSVSLVTRMFALSRDSFDFYLTVLGVQIHKQKSYGGWVL